jgi:tetratricopeptide (TPR) repeat protein
MLISHRCLKPGGHMRFSMLLVGAAMSLTFAGLGSRAFADDVNTCFKESGDEAIAACTRIIQDHGRPAKSREDAYVNRGVEYGKKGDYDRAIADYTEAIRLDPKDPHAYNDRGNAYRYKGDNDRAIADCTEAIRLDPKYAHAYYNRGKARHAKGDYDRAIADYTEAIRLDPKYAGAYHDRGLAKRAKGDTAGGDADIATAKQLNPRIGN